jgi:hypothetical protein
VQLTDFLVERHLRDERAGALDGRIGVGGGRARRGAGREQREQRGDEQRSC